MNDSHHTRLEAEIRQALRSGEREKLQTLRLLLTEVNNRRIELRRPLDEADFHGLVQKAIKQRQESATLFERGGRPELAAKEKREAAWLEDYLPEQVGENEIRAQIEAFVTAGDLHGLAALGTVMKEMLARFAGTADGATIQRIARETLSQQD